MGVFGNADAGPAGPAISAGPCVKCSLPKFIDGLCQVVMDPLSLCCPNRADCPRPRNPAAIAQVLEIVPRPLILVSAVSSSATLVITHIRSPPSPHSDSGSVRWRARRRSLSLPLDAAVYDRVIESEDPLAVYFHGLDDLKRVVGKPLEKAELHCRREHGVRPSPPICRRARGRAPAQICGIS